MAITYGNLGALERTAGDPSLASFYSETVINHYLTTESNCRSLLYYLPLRASNPNAHTSIPLNFVAQTATPFLRRAAAVTGEDFIEWDADDLVGITINLIDQGYMKGQIAMER